MTALVFPCDRLHRPGVAAAPDAAHVAVCAHCSDILRALDRLERLIAAGHVVRGPRPGWQRRVLEAAGAGCPRPAWLIALPSLALAAAALLIADALLSIDHFATKPPPAHPRPADAEVEIGLDPVRGMRGATPVRAPLVPTPVRLEVVDAGVTDAGLRPIREAGADPAPAPMGGS